MEERSRTRTHLHTIPPADDPAAQLRREVARLRMERARMEADMEALQGRLQEALDLGMDLARQRNTYIERFAQSEAARRGTQRELDQLRSRSLHVSPPAPRRGGPAATLRQPPMRAANGDLFDSGELLAVPGAPRSAPHLRAISLEHLPSRLETLVAPPDRGAACVPLLECELPSLLDADEIELLLEELEPVTLVEGC